MSNTKVKSGDQVSFHFSGFDHAGNIVESSLQGDPISITIGRSNLSPGLQRAMIGVKEGEHKTCLVPASDGYADLAHPLYAKDLIYEFKILKIHRPDSIISKDE